MTFLQTLALLLAAAVLAVPLTRRLGFGSILGYLLAGLAIGPAGLGLVTDVETISEVSEFGVVMLLFLIGLELRPTRLWLMRRAVLGLGGAQVLVTGGALSGLAHIVGFPWPAAVVMGFGLAMSSTAIILPMLGDRKLLATPAGRDGFAVLLFQDMAFIPMIALVPLLGGGEGGLSFATVWPAVTKAAVAIVLVLVGGRYLVRPIFRAIIKVNAREIFTAAALLLVAGTAVLVTAVGLSASLGAFMAGVLLSDSEYRHELEADIEPFEGLLLGFFFMSVGMGADLGLLIGRPWFIVGAVAGLVAVKLAIGFVLARIGGEDNGNALRFGTALAQGSEFGFVLFGAAVTAGVMTAQQTSLAMLVVGASMTATPILFALEEAFAAPRLAHRKEKEKPYDVITDDRVPVIICGFGRMGQVIGRLLRLQHIRFTALDRDLSAVEVARRIGYKVFYGDPTRYDLLHAAGAEQAKAIVVTMDDVDASLQIIETAKRYFPNLMVFARARNRRHAHRLMDLGVEHIVRETLHSSLVMSGELMNSLGVPHSEVERVLTFFRTHDERTLREQHAFYADEKRLLQSAKEVSTELATLFEADRVAEAADRLLPSLPTDDMPVSSMPIEEEEPPKARPEPAGSSPEGRRD